MNLIIDIGNTRTKFACFSGTSMEYFNHCDWGEMANIPDLIPDFSKISSVIYSGSKTIDQSLLERLSEIPGLIQLSHNVKVPVNNQYQSPQTLGMDRLAAAVGAYFRFPDTHSVVIDMGTCITMDYLEKGGNFLGGNISPGIQMRLEAMHHYTAALPLVPISIPSGSYGTDTVSALQHGGILGACREIECFVDGLNQRFEFVNVILTGGDAHIFESYTKKQIFVLPYLVMEGLNEILNYNVPKI